MSQINCCHNAASEQAAQRVARASEVNCRNVAHATASRGDGRHDAERLPGAHWRVIRYCLSMRGHCFPANNHSASAHAPPPLPPSFEHQSAASASRGIASASLPRFPSRFITEILPGKPTVLIRRRRRRAGVTSHTVRLGLSPLWTSSSYCSPPLVRYRASLRLTQLLSSLYGTSWLNVAFVFTLDSPEALAGNDALSGWTASDGSCGRQVSAPAYALCKQSTRTQSRAS